MSLKWSNQWLAVKAPTDRVALKPYPFLLMVAILSAALFLPVMGRGFIHDDFIHLYSVAYHSLRRGLTCANGGPFYTPITWLTFKLDWLLWDKKPFLMASCNLLLHVANITLLYAFALKLWRSQIAARWTALGFALLFPANTWAVMWISTRAHLLTTFFYLSALLATLWFIRAERYKRLAAALTIVLFTTLSIFSKESGVTAPLAIAIILIYLSRSRGRKTLPLIPIIGLFGSLIAALVVYALIRARSEAVPISFSGNTWYSYTPSLSVLSENLFRYGWRTYGLLAFMALAIASSQIIRGRRPCLDSFTIDNAALSASLFATTIAPFILLRPRSGIYTYLPGIAAALLLGATARAFYETPLKEKQERQRDGEAERRRDEFSGRPSVPPSLRQPVPLSLRLLSMSPILVVIALYSLLTVVHSLRWMRMAEVNTLVLNQIVARKIEPQPNTLFILTYSKADDARGFPDSMAHGFSCALRMLYADPTLNGSIAPQDASRPLNLQAPIIRLAYVHSGGAPHLVVDSDETCICCLPP